MSIKKFWQNNQEVIEFVFLAFFIWQVLIGSIVFLSEKFIPSSYQYIYVEPKRVINPPVFWSRANFDGIHYLDIARKGYGIHQQAFFPLYPRLISWLTPFFKGKGLLAGLSVSWLSFLLALWLFYKLVKIDFANKVAKEAILFLLVFPTAFYLSMLYTESIFLFLVLASFYFARTKRWWLAGVFGALASATRLAGIFLLPALLVELFQQEETKNTYQKLKEKNILELFPVVLRLLVVFIIPVGLFYYMRFLQIQYGDPLKFLHVQPYFGAGRETDKIILLHQVFWRYFKMLWTVDKFTLTYFVVVLEFLTGLGFLGLLVLSYRRKIRLSYLTFATLSYIAPTLTGTFSSAPRYVLTLFPCFIMMALVENKVIRYSLLVSSSILLIICTALFIQGYWIA